MFERQPSALHRLVCYVLHRLKEELSVRKKQDDPNADHRLVFQQILFLCGDSLRKGDPSLDLGLQTTFRGPTAERAFQPFVQLTTVQTVIRQCEENDWLRLPGPKSHPTNYTLTDLGKRMARGVLYGKDSVEKPFVPKQLVTVDAVVNQWAGSPLWELMPALRKVAAEAYVAGTVVPHYDLSDKALLHYLEGVASRVRGVR